ncbi:MAG: DUF4145 domain-containing protein [Coriobacteriia bacterium]
MEKFSWQCPYCDRHATITSSNFSEFADIWDDGNKDGRICMLTTVTTCPNPECGEYEIESRLFRYDLTGNTYGPVGEALLEWHLKPSSSARVFPDYIPKPILDDYAEACAIRDLSPKASATLSRRCLQGLIRDYWKVSKPRLVDEIRAIKDRVDPLTWEAIDAVRGVGNIGAHMEKDISVIVDVDPGEAAMLIGLLEILMRDWYVARHERELQLESIVSLGAEKRAARHVDIKSS